MMTSVGTPRARGNWDQTQTQNQAQQKQRPQATAEQIRIAQMISDHNDADFEEKVKQLIDITSKNQDECMIALHDCNGDVNRAINVLLEGNPDTDSWEMVGKKKSLAGQKEAGQADGGEESKEIRDREREFSRRRLGGSRRARGTSRGREFRGQENGLDGVKTSGTFGRTSERGRRGRGRGRGLGRRGGRFSAQGMGSPCFRTFNPADYTDPAGADEYYGNANPTWNSGGGFETDDGTRLQFTGSAGTNCPRKFETVPGAWRTATEEWGTDDWSEDSAPGTSFLTTDDKRSPPKAVNGCYQLSETKIFTASNVAALPSANETVTITAGQRIDLAVLLGKQPSVSESETAALDSSVSQPLVFNNSKQHALPQPSPPTTFARHNMVSMLSKSFSDVGEPKAVGVGGGNPGSQLLEQLKTAQALAQLAAQHTQPSANPTSTSWDLGPTTQPSVLGHFELKSQAESAVHSGPFAQRPSFSGSSMMEVFIPTKQPAAPSNPPLPGKPGAAAAQMSPGSTENQSSSPQPAQHKLKPQKKKASISSKIPSSAVEMPASADVAGLSLQFGALQFGSEPMISEYESTATSSVAVSQPPSSLYTSVSSESTPVMANPSPDSSYQPSAISTPTFTPQSSAPYDASPAQRAPYANSLSSSPQKDLAQAKNGFSVAPTSQPMEVAPGSTGKPDSPAASMASLSNAVSASSMLNASSQQHPVPLASLTHTEDMPSTTNAQQSSTPSTQQCSSLTSSSARTSTSTHLHTTAENDANIHPPPSTFATAPSAVLAVPSSSVPNALGAGVGVSSLGLSLAGNSTITVSSRNSVASTSGKGPPNLPPGVPPLLPNPYIMAPGLLPAYQPQVYGYDDLQMLQTRFPLDYYGIPFATPTTPITGREASLSNNPYSGDLTKFGRGDASSPAPATTMAQPQQNQTQTHHTAQQTFLNPALPPGYSYTSLPYYAGMPGLPNTFQYGPAMFAVPPTTTKQHGVGVNVNATATAFQQASGYGTHGYSTAGVSVTSSNTGVPDISGSVYSKTQQSFEKQGFHAGTPAASFNLPSALGSGGPVNPATAAGYPPPFMHILTPHQQQMHSQILHLQQDGQACLQLFKSGTGQRTQASSIQQKAQVNKSAYNSSGYWGPN